MCQGSNFFQHEREILVKQHAKDKYQMLVGEIVFEGPAKDGNPCRIVPAVNDKPGSSLKNLRTAHPVRFMHSPVNGTVINREAVVCQYFYRCESKGSIFNLVLTWKRAIQSLIIFADSMIIKNAVPMTPRSYMSSEPVKLRISFPACLVKNLQNRFLFCRRAAHTFIFDDPRLFPRYVSQRGAQIFAAL